MKKFHFVLIAVYFAVLAWSAFTKDYFTWILEAAPGIAAFIILACTFRRFRFTNFTYCFILIHCVILFVGAKYTYAEVPLFNTLKDMFDMQRNNYDKVGHFAQGFIPAMAARELLLRLEVVPNRRGWRPFIVVSICLAISALYELIEWLTAVLTGEAADAFLGTQGYVWDTQSDMLCALIGAILMLLFFSRAQDKALDAAFEVELEEIIEDARRSITNIRKQKHKDAPRKGLKRKSFFAAKPQKRLQRKARSTVSRGNAKLHGR